MTIPDLAKADPCVDCLEDVQNRCDSRHIDINKVGVKEIRYPITLAVKGGGRQHTTANINMYVNLPHHFKGTHMSRFLEVLSEHHREISVERIGEILAHMQTRLEAEAAHIEMTFDYFIMKKAPVSEAESLMDYQVTFRAGREGAVLDFITEVAVPVTSLCPCSKAISQYGAHNQRSLVTVRVGGTEKIWIEDLIRVVEEEASCELFGVLKRPDEKWVTEHAYENPRFVEDTVRDVAARLLDDERITWFQVEAENFESIHNHNAYAMIEQSKV